MMNNTRLYSLSVLLLITFACGISSAQTAQTGAVAQMPAPAAEEPTVQTGAVAQPPAPTVEEPTLQTGAAAQPPAPVAAEPPSQPTAEPEEEKSLGALTEEPGFDVGARLYAMWMLRDELYQPTNEFRVNLARVKLGWTQWNLVEAVVKVDLDQFIQDAGDTVLLRDLYVRVQPWYWLSLKMGQFKKPFSRIELLSRRRFPLIRRGMANDYITEHLLYGDRDVGLMLEGRLWKRAKLDYAVGIFNGMGMNNQELGFDGHKDIAARLESRPVKWLSVGANVSLKLIETEDLPGFVNQDNFAYVEPREYPQGYTAIDFMAEHEWMTGTAWMAGVDGLVRVGKLQIVVEGTLGENWWFKKYPYVWSAVLMASYKYKLPTKWPLWVEPVVQGEVLTLMPSMDRWRNRMWRVMPGVNLHVGKYVRLMVDGEFLFAQGTESDIDGSRRDGLWPNEWPGAFDDSWRLMVQAAFSI